MHSLLKPQMLKPARVSHLAAVRARGGGAQGHRHNWRILDKAS